jgi:hypothetical protein
MTGKFTSTNARPTPCGRTDLQSVTFDLVAVLALHPDHANNLVRAFGRTSGAELVGYDDPRDATHEHIARAARAFKAASSQRPCRRTRDGSRVPSSALPLRAAEPYGTKKSATWELTGGRLNDDCGEEPDGPTGFDGNAERARQFAAEMILPVPCPGWARPRGRSRPMPTSPARTANSTRRPRHRLPRWNAAPTQSIWLPSRRHDERWRGRRRTRFRSGRWWKTPGCRSPCLLPLRRPSGGRAGPGRVANGRSQRHWPCGRVRHESAEDHAATDQAAISRVVSRSS